jgi:hypothetical protein
MVRLSLSAFAILLTLDAAASPSKATTAGSNLSDTEGLIRQMASAAPDDCSAAAPSPSASADVDQLENRMFEAVKVLVADRLNAPSPASGSTGASRAMSALREIEESSTQINKNWPAEDRFHFKVLYLAPSILIQMSYRSQTDLALFGSYNLNKYASLDPGTKWREVDLVDPDSPVTNIDLFALRRGPSGHARFLAKVSRSGCAGSIGEAYYGYEWSSDVGQIATEIIKIEGAEGLDDSASTHVGRLSTTGKTIQLPYCFFSAVDTWDNPTLCAADSFDLSGDNPHFGGRIYNRPDLVTVANAVKYAETRDYVALRGYCASHTVARKLVREVPPDLSAETLDTVRAGPARETVVLADGAVRFDLIKRRSRWLVEKFNIASGRTDG